MNTRGVLPQISSSSITTPLSAVDYATLVLAPEVAVCLIAEDMNLGCTLPVASRRAAAYELLSESRDFGKEMFPDGEWDFGVLDENINWSEFPPWTDNALYNRLVESDTDDMIRDVTLRVRLQEDLEGMEDDGEDDIDAESTSPNRATSPTPSAGHQDPLLVFDIQASYESIDYSHSGYLPPNHGTPIPHGVLSQRPVSNAEQEQLCVTRSPRMAAAQSAREREEREIEAEARAREKERLLQERRIRQHEAALEKERVKRKKEQERKERERRQRQKKEEREAKQEAEKIAKAHRRRKAEERKEKAARLAEDKVREKERIQEEKERVREEKERMREAKEIAAALKMSKKPKRPTPQNMHPATTKPTRRTGASNTNRPKAKPRRRLDPKAPPSTLPATASETHSAVGIASRTEGGTGKRQKETARNSTHNDLQQEQAVAAIRRNSVGGDRADQWMGNGMARRIRTRSGGT
ncbi:hypothetical protein NliqN6_2956 [Naganishia liquefaciens]|uniref:Restriction of telomere capping protein 4 C-terminal domain-containing protein n=1 Tax=Naganishia liquefaciens TaxID=104408 RepID=A0A8H3TUT6_9TREE|nr:hypothetical protein NliqN6_2956 [Naganishia liquefaciens]